MPASNVEERVKKLPATHFEVSESEINRATAFNGEPPLKADSLDLSEVIMELEDEFHIRISDDDVENIKSVGDVVDYVEKSPEAE